MKKRLDTIIKNPNRKKPKVRKKEAKPEISKQGLNLKTKLLRLAAVVFKTVRRNKTQYKAGIVFLAIFLLALVLLLNYFKPALEILSFKRDGRYLFLFQNNAELRGGGGFLGSFAVVDVKNGEIGSFYFESNIYKKDNEFEPFSPYNLPPFLAKHIGGNLTMRDANYSADFAQAAKEVSKFYRLEYGRSVDGVVAINAQAVSDLLKITGPVKVESYKVKIDSSNFFNAVQSIVDNRYFKDELKKQVNEPKAILQDMVDPLAVKAAKASKIKLYNYLKRELSRKQILFWFKDGRQKLVEDNNWGGRVRDTASDYLFISNSNVIGGKSSIYIEQKTVVSAPSRKSLERTVTISRKHLGGKSYLADRPNQNYTRVYLPGGSVVREVLLNGSSLEKARYNLYGEFGKTVVGAWTTVAQGEELKLEINYRLPKDTVPDRILIQKQPGSVNETVRLEIGGRKFRELKLDKDLLI